MNRWALETTHLKAADQANCNSLDPRCHFLSGQILIHNTNTYSAMNCLKQKTHKHVFSKTKLQPWTSLNRKLALSNKMIHNNTTQIFLLSLKSGWVKRAIIISRMTQTLSSRNAERSRFARLLSDHSQTRINSSITTLKKSNLTTSVATLVEGITVGVRAKPRPVKKRNGNLNQSIPSLQIR